MDARDMFGSYCSPEEAAAAAADETDKALGAVISMLAGLFMEKRNIRMELEELDTTMDEDEVAELEWRLKMIKSEESSLHRIESGLQSRLRVA